MIRDLITPEAHKDPYVWLVVYAAHYWLGIGLWGVVALALTQWQAAWLVPLAYFFCWEGLQLFRSKTVDRFLIWDSVLDSVGIAMACYSAACLGHGLRLEAVACWGASVVVAVVGAMVRECRQSDKEMA